MWNLQDISFFNLLSEKCSIILMFNILSRGPQAPDPIYDSGLGDPQTFD